MIEFILNTKIISGNNALLELDLSKSKRVSIFTDNNMLKIGACDSTINLLKNKNINYEIFSDIEPDPSFEIVIKCLSKILSFDSDTIIAIGGGSVIDTAKSVIYFALEVNKRMSDNLKKPIFIAVPTTSGTGSEVTSYAIITDKETHRKVPLVSNEMLPDIALLDPQFTMTVPPRITAETGMDVMAHAFESYVSVNASPFTMPYSEHAIVGVFNNISKAVHNGKDIDARIAMHELSCIAGVAFNNAGLGLIHAMAHSLGGRFRQPHGRANAILMPYVIEYNAKNCEKSAKKYAKVIDLLNVKNIDDVSASCEILKHLILELNKNIGINQKITEYGVDKNEFENAIEEMASNALKDVCLLTNPVKPSLEDVKNIYRKLI
ncbi:1-propanol dehydrogenase PduQ [Brachyspira innocens]|uniref:1-propanol dehydrogenase PduQ n=1 Tax=Brachyspira innocens TaxID=13264 RepID=A0ABT8YZX9_9SPIR|nr:1-propanol dehydrogenase PduQ [Brachyspira innocens]MDO6993377.1 1-propanol dehydrogenase PduQ [Brachyspira innocens]MDO7021448.1 1-propanol dehydrogenase PduQ [Brachyspira innocens]